MMRTPDFETQLLGDFPTHAVRCSQLVPSGSSTGAPGRCVAEARFIVDVGTDNDPRPAGFCGPCTLDVLSGRRGHQFLVHAIGPRTPPTPDPVAPIRPPRR